MDITETDTTSAESDKVTDPAADRDNPADTPKSTEVDEGDTGGVKIDISNKQDSSQADAEVDPKG